MKDLYKNLYRRESLRLKNWDYSRNAAYFVTICTKNKTPFFGEIHPSPDGAFLHAREPGIIANDCWLAIPEHFPTAITDEFIIMPDHMHGIIILKNPDVPTSHDLSRQPAQEKTRSQKRFQNPGKSSIPTIIGLYKSSVTRLARKINPEFAWQADYYERIVQDPAALKTLRSYITNNPEKYLQKKKT